MPFSLGTFTKPAASPVMTAPGTESREGSASRPPSGIVFAPQPMRSPPSNSGRISGWVLNSCSRSCTESDASV